MYKQFERIFSAVEEMEGKPDWFATVGVYLNIRIELLWATIGEESVETLQRGALESPVRGVVEGSHGWHP